MHNYLLPQRAWFENILRYEIDIFGIIKKNITHLHFQLNKFAREMTVHNSVFPNEILWCQINF